MGIKSDIAHHSYFVSASFIPRRFFDVRWLLELLQTSAETTCRLHNVALLLIVSAVIKTRVSHKLVLTRFVVVF